MPKSFNINDFRARVSQYGLHRNNKWRVAIPMPPIMQTMSWSNQPRSLNNLAMTGDLQYWCEAGSIPGTATNLRPLLRYGYGSIEKKPVGNLFSDINLVFMMDGDANIYTFFQTWMQGVVNSDMSRGLSDGSTNNYYDAFEVNYKTDYMVDMMIEAFNDAGETTFQIILREAFPVFVPDLPLNWADNQNTMKLPITFTFMDWYNNKTKNFTANV